MDQKPKVLVLGIDGMDPSLTRKFVDEGIMPNTKKMLERGAARHDLYMMGGHPTITPPMWTTLSTGAYPTTHGITDFHRSVPGKIARTAYNLDSRYCLAEQLWDVTAEAGYKTLVWEWPGASWPPTSDNPNLYVVDGTSPGVPGNSAMCVDTGYMLVGNEKITELKFQAKAATDSNVACVIENLHAESTSDHLDLADLIMNVDVEGSEYLILDPLDGEMQLTDNPYDVVMTPIKPATGWGFDVPEGAKEFAMLFQGGTVRRVGLILKGKDGIYDHVVLYKNKKTSEEIVTLDLTASNPYVWDEGFSRNGEKIDSIYRWMRVLDIAKDGSHLAMWIGYGFDATDDSVWYPRSLYKEIVEHAGYPVGTNMVGGADKKLIRDCTMESWAQVGQWYRKALGYTMDEMGMEVIFSHYHNIDACGHQIVKYLRTGHNDLTAEDYRELCIELYKQTDDYIGSFLPYLDKGWTILVLSDHGQICPEHEAFFGLGEASGVNVRFLEQLGYTTLKKDENGKELRQIDWEHTKAIASRGNQIWINLKGRDEFGIVDPADKYDLESQIITDMYSFKHPETGRCIFSMVLRNKDAALVGLSGPLVGDIVYFLAEGYNFDHGCSLSTTTGIWDTCVGPVFLAAGPGIKENFETTRMIREVDVAPTMAMLLKVRMPNECEGAPIYQILK